MRQKLADLINSLYAFRNIILWLLLFGASVVFRLKSYIDGAQFVDLCKNTFLGLAAVHGTEHIISVVSDYVTAFKGPKDAQPPPDPQAGNLVEGDGK